MSLLLCPECNRGMSDSYQGNMCLNCGHPFNVKIWRQNTKRKEDEAWREQDSYKCKSCCIDLLIHRN